jgi:hypothetical protein
MKPQSPLFSSLFLCLVSFVAKAHRNGGREKGVAAEEAEEAEEVVGVERPK